MLLSREVICLYPGFYVSFGQLALKSDRRDCEESTKTDCKQRQANKRSFHYCHSCHAIRSILKLSDSKTAQKNKCKSVTWKKLTVLLNSVCNFCTTKLLDTIDFTGDIICQVPISFLLNFHRLQNRQGSNFPIEYSLPNLKPCLQNLHIHEKKYLP